MASQKSAQTAPQQEKPQLGPAAFGFRVADPRGKVSITDTWQPRVGGDSD